MARIHARHSRWRGVVCKHVGMYVSRMYVHTYLQLGSMQFRLHLPAGTCHRPPLPRFQRQAVGRHCTRRAREHRLLAKKEYANSRPAIGTLKWEHKLAYQGWPSAAPETSPRGVVKCPLSSLVSYIYLMQFFSALPHPGGALITLHSACVVGPVQVVGSG